MIKHTGRLAWTIKDGLCAPNVTRTSRDCGEMKDSQEMKELGALSLEIAAQPVIQLMPISLKPAAMQTGLLPLMGESLE